jgi:ABC-type transport system involved in multi-copper enzyme maturation permease subunit
MNSDSTTASLTPPRASRDFPDWLPPLVVRELRAGLRGHFFTGALLLFHVCMITGAVYSAASSNRETTGVFFWLPAEILLCICTPIMAGNSLRREIKQRGMELLLLGGLTPWQIVCGKWQAAMLQVLLIAVSLLPYLLFRYFIGGVEITQDVVELFYVCCAACVLTAVYMWLAGMRRGVRILVMVLFFIFAPFVLSFLGMIAVSSTGTRWWHWLLLVPVDSTIITSVFLSFAQGCVGRTGQRQRHPFIRVTVFLAVALCVLLPVTGAGLGISVIQMLFAFVMVLAVIMDSPAPGHAQNQPCGSDSPPAQPRH